MRTDLGGACPAGPPAVSAHPARLRSLVLIEDDRDMAYLLGRAFERSGSFTMAGQATNFERLKPLLETQPPEVVVVDARLPGESDLALVPVVRSSCPEATIVVLTGLSCLRGTWCRRSRSSSSPVSRAFDLTCV
jgi:ActR/RegA family two-component response regulator